MAGGTPLATAFIEVRGDTRRLPDDIQGGLRGTRQSGRRAGNDLGDGLREGSRSGTRGLNDDLERSTRDTGRRSGGGFGGAFAAAGASALGPLGAAVAGIFAVDAIKDFFSESVTSLQRIERINVQTETVIASMGNAAGVSAQHVEDLAGNLENLTASEAETTQEGANLLLTFGNIRNGVGDGNDIFDQTVKTMVDMSRAMGTDASASAIQLGKALNDPVKGITALSKVGVSFSAEQKELITTLTESGDVMGAQKIILGSLEQQFGGSAEAFAKTTEGKVELAKHAIGTLGETMSEAALPVLGSFATKAADALNGAAEAFPGFVEDVKGFIEPLKSAVAPVADTLEAGFKDGVDKAKGALSLLFTGDFTGSTRDLLGVEEDDELITFLFEVRDALIETRDSAVEFGQGLLVQFGPAIDTARDVGDTVLEVFGSIRDSVVDFVQSENVGVFFERAQVIIGAVVDWIMANVVPFLAENLPQVIATVGDAFTLVGGVIGLALDIIEAGIGIFVGVVSYLWEHFGDTILFFVTSAWDLISGVIGGALDVIQGLIGFFIALVTGDWEGLGDSLAQIGRGAMDIVSSIFTGALDALEGAFRLAVDAIGVIWDGLQEVVKTPIRFVIETVLNQGLIDGFNWIAEAIGADGLKIPHIPLPKGFSGGGYTGDGGKYEPKGIVHAGEVVWSQDDVAAWGGPSAVDMMRRAREGFANGGIVKLGNWFESKGARVTENSAFGGVTPGVHKGKGHAGDYAIDVNYGPGGENATEKAFFDSVADQVRSWGYKVLWRVAGHFNHLHAETQNSQGGGSVGEDGGFLSGLLGGLSDPVKFLTDKVSGLFGGMPAAGALGDILKAVPGTLVESLVDKAQGAASSVLDFLTGDDDTSGGGAGVREQVRAIAAQRGWGTGTQWDSLAALIAQESSFNPNAANPSSSARGLFQKMTSIHGPVEKTVAGQTQWGLNYIAGRYGNPAAAWAFHKRNNYYAAGTPSAVGGLSWVGENGPELVDFRGGERVYNANMSRRMEGTALREQVSASPLVGSVTLQSTGNVSADLDTLHHKLKMIDRGGAYRRRRGN